MREKKRVVIYDDEEGLRKEWEAKLLEVDGFTEGFEVYVANNDEFESSIGALRERRLSARADQETPEEGTFFDDADILIVDYDLFKDKETGEEVAYLARCFSDCGIIIGVNQFAREGLIFDLTLQGHPESFADLNVLDEQLFVTGLWSYCWDKFRPWYWPHLPTAVEDFRRRIREAEKNFDRKILEYLISLPEVREILPKRALEFISAKDASAATFRSFVNESGEALHWKDKVVSKHAGARIAAARLFKCLERLVLPGQNILVDAAHLLERYPSLFRGGSPGALISWKNSHELLFPGESVIDLKKIENFRFKRNAWLSRTAWYWPLVSECEEIAEVTNPWMPRERIAFCEDISNFVRPSEELPEFVAKVDSPFVRRFVSRRDPKYGPKQQLAL